MNIEEAKMINNQELKEAKKVMFKNTALVLSLVYATPITITAITIGLALKRHSVAATACGIGAVLGYAVSTSYTPMRQVLAQEKTIVNNLKLNQKLLNQGINPYEELTSEEYLIHKKTKNIRNF